MLSFQRLDVYQRARWRCRRRATERPCRTQRSARPRSRIRRPQHRRRGGSLVGCRQRQALQDRSRGGDGMRGFPRRHAPTEARRTSAVPSRYLPSRSRRRHADQDVLSVNVRTFTSTFTFRFTFRSRSTTTTTTTARWRRHPSAGPRAVVTSPPHRSAGRQKVGQIATMTRGETTSGRVGLSAGTTRRRRGSALASSCRASTAW